MNETRKRRGLARSIASLTGLATLTGVAAVLEARRTAHDNDPTVIDLQAQEAERQKAESDAEERKWRRHYLGMAIVHYLTLALLLVAAALLVILFFGSMAARDNAIRRGQPVPQTPDLTLPVPIPVL